MLRNITICGLAIGLALVFLAEATEARRRWIRRRSILPVVDVWGEATTDQAKCQAEAAYMAAAGLAYHVGPNIGAFEGFGVGGSAACETCRPSWPATLTGDAASQATNGRWYRVRSWR